MSLVQSHLRIWLHDEDESTGEDFCWIARSGQIEVIVGDFVMDYHRDLRPETEDGYQKFFVRDTKTGRLWLVESELEVKARVVLTEQVRPQNPHEMDYVRATLRAMSPADQEKALADIKGRVAQHLLNQENTEGLK